MHIYGKTLMFAPYFGAVTYKVTAFFFIKILNKKKRGECSKNILPAFKIYRYFSTFQVFVPALLPENRKI